MGYRLKTYGNLIVVRWIGEPAPGEPTAIFAAVARAHEALGRPLLYMGIHDVDSQEPGSEARSEVISGWDEGMAPVEACYHVLSRSTLVALAQRSFYRGMLAAARALGLRSLGKMYFVATVDQALERLLPSLTWPLERVREQMKADGLV